MSREIINAQLIKKIFLDEQENRIGTYSVKNAVVKSIYIGAKVPKNYVAEGLEILISPTGKMAQIQPTVNNGVILYPEFEVRFIERASGCSLDEILRWAILRFSVTRPPFIIDETDDIFHQASLRIPDYLGVS